MRKEVVCGSMTSLWFYQIGGHMFNPQKYVINELGIKEVEQILVIDQINLSLENDTHNNDDFLESNCESISSHFSDCDYNGPCFCNKKKINILTNYYVILESIEHITDEKIKKKFLKQLVTTIKEKTK